MDLKTYQEEFARQVTDRVYRERPEHLLERRGIDLYARSLELKKQREGTPQRPSLPARLFAGILTRLRR